LTVERRNAAKRVVGFLGARLIGVALTDTRAPTTSLAR
jgi:hypothetical protein